MNWGPSRWEGTNAMGDQWNGRCVGANWGTNGIGDQWDGGPLGLAEIGWMNEKGDQYVVEDLWIEGPMRRGPMSWGTNGMGDQWVGGTNEMGDQWNGWCMGANWGTNEMGGWWVGGPMRWGTNEMGDQWDGGPLGLADDGVTNEKGDQWDGGPVIWGTNEMGDQWAPIMYWGTNELGDQWEGDQWDGGPMRWGTSERIPCKQPWGWWFETPSRSLCRHRNITDSTQTHVALQFHFRHTCLLLTNRDRNKMTDCFQTTFSNAFYVKKKQSNRIPAEVCSYGSNWQ